MLWYGSVQPEDWPGLSGATHRGAFTRKPTECICDTFLRLVTPRRSSMACRQQETALTASPPGLCFDQYIYMSHCSCVLIAHGASSQGRSCYFENHKKETRRTTTQAVVVETLGSASLLCRPTFLSHVHRICSSTLAAIVCCPGSACALLTVRSARFLASGDKQNQ